MNIRGTWVLPTVRDSGGPLPITEIDRTDIEVSLDAGATWTPLISVASGNTQEFFLPDAAPGQWDFRGVVFDTAGRFSPPVGGSVVVPDETAPGPITDLNITLE